MATTQIKPSNVQLEATFKATMAIREGTDVNNYLDWFKKTFREVSGSDVEIELVSQRTSPIKE